MLGLVFMLRQREYTKSRASERVCSVQLCCSSEVS